MKKIWIIEDENQIFEDEKNMLDWCRQQFISDKHQLIGKLKVRELEVVGDHTVDFDYLIESMVRESRINGIFEEPHTQFRLDMEDLFRIMQPHSVEKLRWLRMCCELNGWRESNCRKILGANKQFMIRTIPARITKSGGDVNQYYEALAKVKNFTINTENNKIDIKVFD